MKKIFYLASIAALALSSCAKDQTTEAQIEAVKGGSKITAALEANDTRTHLASDCTFRWSESDQIGVYGDGTNTLRNAAFTVSPGDAGKAQGVFTSQDEELVAGKHYLAVYPRFQQNRLFDVVNWTKNTQLPFKDEGVKGDIMNESTIRVSIPATQTYKNGSFYTGMAPAISNNFTVAENGIGSLTMQPVADYLFVNIKSTEPIEQIELQLVKNDGKTYYNIAGTATLNKYALENEDIRYYASVDENNAATVIKLETNESDKAVTCHDPNTYVFVVPGGILGKDEDVRAIITVNGHKSGATNNKFVATSTSNLIDGKATVTNGQLNYAVPNPLKDANDSDNKKSFRKVTSKTNVDKANVFSDNKIYTMQLENMVFWMNPMIDTNNDGKADTRSSFEYNPEGDVIIENEAELLQYLVEYEKNVQGANDANTKFANKNAFICDNYKFDFSIINIENLSAKLKSLGIYSEYEKYLKDYVGTNGVFPCISKFNNEFNGNGATISGIVRPLASDAGIFGQISGTITDVTFSGITPKTVVISNQGHNYPGYVLGSMTESGVIDDVTVDKAKGMAVLGAGNVAAYEELTLTNVEGLNFIIADMNLEKDLKFKNFDVASKAAINVFATLNAEMGSTGDTHHVVTLPANAKYDALAMYIGNDDTAYQNEINNAVARVADAPRNVVVNNDENVVSVLVGETSYWTGDKFPLSYNANLYPKTFTEGAYKDWYKLEYAEQLATGATDELDAYVMRNMNLSKSPMPWEMVTVRKLEADGKTTISGLNMAVALNPDQESVKAIAPVDAAQIKNLIVDGVTIDIYTPQGTCVPDVIGGLAWRAQLVENVTLKNLTITGDGQGANNEDYNGEKPVIIGWLVGDAKDITVKNSKVVGVNSDITGIAGLVGKVSFSDYLASAANIENSYAQNVKAQTALTKFRDVNAITDTAWANLNTAGTAVGLVENTTKTTKSIKITGTSGKAVFLFDTMPEIDSTGTLLDEGPINVLYGIGNPITLKFYTREYWW